MHSAKYLVLGTAILLFSVGVPITAQRPGETGVYTVAYIDVMPSARAAMVTALKRYRDTSRTEGGYVRVDPFEQVGWPGHFSVIEAWNDQNALDAHGMAASTMQLQDALRPIRLSGYDQRPYKPLTVVLASVAGNGQALHIVAHVDIVPGGPPDEAPGLLTRLAEASRKEPGSLRFDVLQHSMRGNHFTVIETWESQNALDAHAAAVHTRQYRDALQRISGSPLDERLYKAVE